MTSLPHVLLLFGSIGTSEILFILLLVVLLFGAHRIPELARALGRAQREFQRARDDVQRELETQEQPEDERVRRAARDLGISVEGKSTEELRAAIATKVQTPRPA